MIKSSEIRKQFIEFFENKKGHKFVRSSAVVPHDDPTLLFINAGMNQFKPFFIGSQNPVSNRVVNSQKCIRVSGKHNDLEEVGVDNYHHTFFEMLGNWSFGDYYKKEAIVWAWELLTEVWKLDKNRLWVTIFQDDDESAQLWKDNTDINSERILKFGHKDNFWEMGDTGPCGPCTEIHYYMGDDINKQSGDGVNNLEEYREIWNLVFIQYNRDNNGKLLDLPAKHVDTGAGFERLVAILNNKKSNYDTDLFIPLLDAIVEISKKQLNYNNGIPHRVIADHIRMLAFSIADGTMPSNEGRGYVVRRVLRRAARFGKILQIDKPFLYKLIEPLSEIMGKVYPEIIDKRKHVEKVIYAEELGFNQTLDRGLDEFNKIIDSIEPNSIIAGIHAFKLYDTYGFPLDLTELLAKENGYTVNIKEFNDCMSRQKENARNSGKFYINSDNVDWIKVSKEKKTTFLGYKEHSSLVSIIKYRSISNRYEVVLDKTPFYAESGGQISDSGVLMDQDFCLLVEDVQNIDDQFVHIGKIKSGSIDNVNNLQAQIDSNRRKKIQRNHTATHLIHQALKMILGEHVQQAGSLVGPDSLRFDLTHYEKISEEQILMIEKKVNDIILENKIVNTEIKDYDIARKEGAVSLFNEKYDDIVRVVDVSKYSKELCGGTHVSNTGEIGCLKIISESALASGVRRIIAVTGDAIPKLINKQDAFIKTIKNELKCSEEDMILRLHTLIKNKKLLEKENLKLKESSVSNEIDMLINKASFIGDIRIVIEMVQYSGDLRDLGDQFRQAFKTNGVSLIGTVQKNKPMIMCAITDDLVAKFNAGSIVKEVSTIIEGGGGGKPHLATAGGTNISQLESALDHGENIIKNKLSIN